MQTTKGQLERQQQIMAALGFYRGKVDGIWSTKTIEAKKAWELSGKFGPGIPNFGLPLANKGPYPRGIRIDPVTKLLTCSQLEVYLQAQEKQKEKHKQHQAPTPGATPASEEEAD